VLLFTAQATSTQLVVAQPQKPSPLAPVVSTVKQPLSVTENVRKTVLEWSLTVLTKEVKTAPGEYKVYSTRNGIAHQLEHMLLKAPPAVQFGRLFSALGSDSNAFTSYDQLFTRHRRADKLKALVLEADRMQNALINAEQLTSEKRVVISSCRVKITQTTA